jgi:hypothetical protein
MCMCVAVVAWSWHVSVNSCDDVWSSRPQSRPQRGLSLLSSPAIAMQAITAALCSACCCSLHRVAKADGLTDTLRCGLFSSKGSPAAGRQGLAFSRATGAGDRHSPGRRHCYQTAGSQLANSFSSMGRPAKMPATSKRISVSNRHPASNTPPRTTKHANQPEADNRQQPANGQPTPWG